MSEEETKEEVNEEEEGDVPKKENKPKSDLPGQREVKTDPVGDANKAAERLEKANKDLADLLDKQVKMKVENILGGESEAGAQEKSKEEVEIDEAKKMLEGTGFEDMAFPKKEDKK